MFLIVSLLTFKMEILPDLLHSLVKISKTAHVTMLPRSKIMLCMLPFTKGWE